jgi:outer membrane biosynthesis protein TonB
VFVEEATIPAWLDERMRADALGEENAAWSSLWKRRAVTWSVGLSLLATVAAGGLWLYEDNRVDGALVVVARTTPEAPAPPPVPVPVAAAPVAPILPLTPEPDPVPVPTAAPVVVQDELEQPPPAAPVRPKTSVRRATPPRQVASAEPTSRQRREETLMQCRAHGLDQRRCDLQGCSMTRYGFACRGN